MALLIRSITNKGSRISAHLLYRSGGCRFGVAAMSTSKVFPVITKSPTDKRLYRGLELPNKMKVVLVQDTETDKAAASLSVAAGSMCDPIELPGLAHFCEHMLFLGTEKYPSENEYSKYLSDHGGSSNAYTAKDHTNYYFDVSPKSLSDVLDRFSQFFISPLFTETATEREVNAVHSEHDKNITSDTWRLHQLEVGTSNPDHPYSRFATGNRDTLWLHPQKNNVDVRKSLLDYHSKFYSANLMNLAILGTEDLDVLQGYVESMFNSVRNIDAVKPKWEDNPYGSNEFKTTLEVVPVKDIRQLNILFGIPDMTQEYKTSAEGYLTHLIGHEGKGSLLSFLKEKSWVNHLEAGAHSPARGFGVFKVSVDLTPEGMLHTQDIVKHVFQYIKMLRDTGPQKRIWDEIRDISAMQFRFKDKERPQNFVAYLTSAMHNDYPMEDVLSVGYILKDYKPELIEQVLNCLTPDKCRVTVTAKEFEDRAKLVEKWYGVNYNSEKIDEQRIADWSSCTADPKLTMPSENEFIPTVFDMKPRRDTGVVPELYNHGSSRVWILQDNEFLLPKACARLELYSNLPLRDPVHSNLNFLLCSAVKDQLTEFSYAAGLAGLHYSIVDTVYGLEILIHGYDHKLPKLLKRVLEHIAHFKVDRSRFEMIKEYYRRSMINWEDDQPYLQATYYLSYLLREKKFSNQELLEAIEETTPEGLEAYARQFVSNLHFEWLLFGNFTVEEAQALQENSEKIFEGMGTKKIANSNVQRQRELVLPEGCNHVFNRNHKSHLSSCCATLFQTGLQSRHENVIVELIEHILSEPCFNQLRTVEQLGYVVFTNVRRSSGTQGLQIGVQSSRTPEYVESRMDTFLKEFKNVFQNMTQEEFQQHRDALAVRKLEKPKKQFDRAKLLWSEISGQQYQFTRQEMEVEELKTIKLEEIIAFFDKLIGPTANSRKRLSVRVRSIPTSGPLEADSADNGPKDFEALDLNEIRIEDPVAWKKRQALYPEVLNLYTPTTRQTQAEMNETIGKARL